MLHKDVWIAANNKKISIELQRQEQSSASTGRAVTTTNYPNSWISIQFTNHPFNFNE